MKRLWQLLSLAAWFTLVLAGCGGSSGGSGGGTSSATATGVFVDKPVKGIKCVFGSYSSMTDAGGAFTYPVGTKGTFKIGNLVIGEAVGGPTVTVVDLVKTAKPTLTDAQAQTEALKIVQFLMTLDDNSDTQTIVITPAVFTRYTGATYKGKDLLTENLPSLCQHGKPGAVFVNSTTARSQLNTSLGNLSMLKYAGEYVSSSFGGDSAANVVIRPDGTLKGVAADQEGEVFDLKGSVALDGTLSVQVYLHGSSTPLSGVTITAKADGAGTITGQSVDTRVTPTKTRSFTLNRVTSSTNKYTGLYAGPYSGTSSGSWAFAVDRAGSLLGFAGGSGSEVGLSGTVNTTTGAITLGAVTGGGSFKGTIAANGSVSGTWTATGDSGTFTGSKVVLW